MFFSFLTQRHLPLNGADGCMFTQAIDPGF
jgi:hypothetical protein